MPFTSNSNKIYLRKVHTNERVCFLRLLLYAIRRTYFELDFTYFLYNLKEISQQDYKKRLYYDLPQIFELFLEYQKRYPLHYIEFQKIMRFQKENYEGVEDSVILGRIGELLSYAIFCPDVRINEIFFKKMYSKIFQPGIDLFLIKYDLSGKRFLYYFYEIKTTDNEPHSAISQINHWYESNYFTKKYLCEYSALKKNLKYDGVSRRKSTK